MIEFESNINLVYKVMQVYFAHLPSYLYEDCTQEGMIGLFRACQTYDETRGRAAFSTYAVICIKNQVLQYLRKEHTKWGENITSGDVITLDNDGAGASTVLEMIPAFEDIETVVTYNAALDVIAESDYSDVMLLYIAGYTQREIAKALGISQPVVSRKIARCCELVKQALEAKSDD